MLAIVVISVFPHSNEYCNIYVLMSGNVRSRTCYNFFRTQQLILRRAPSGGKRACRRRCCKTILNSRISSFDIPPTETDLKVVKHMSHKMLFYDDSQWNVFDMKDAGGYVNIFPHISFFLGNRYR